MDTSRLVSVAAGREAPDLVLKNAAYLDVFTGRFLHGDIALCGDRIAGVGKYDGPVSADCTGKTVVPGFIDGHIHLESSVVRPSEFARIVLPQGTSAVVTDPHEIANVLGRRGVEYMLASTRDLPLDVYVMVPSCVPATPFDESGAELTHEDVQALMGSERVLGLAEMMNFVGTVNADPEVLLKIKAAKDARKFVDGHAPGLSGQSLNAYAAAGVESDHECTTAEEAMEKLSLGQRIMIRDGTAGHNLAALLPLLEPPLAERCMFVTDDKHPGDLMRRGHINAIIREAIAAGARPETAYTVASFGAAEYFDLRDRGAVAPGYLADLVVLNDVRTVSIHSVYRRGRLVDEAMLAECDSHAPEELEKAVTDTVHLDPVRPEDFAIGRARVIGLVPGELLTTDEGFADGYDAAHDICKVCVIERHRRTGHKGICWMRGYGIQNGAVATSVSHDSHNIIAAGASDKDIAAAVNALIAMHGGMAVVSEGRVLGSLPMPIAGLISNCDAASAQAAMDGMKKQAWALGASKDIDPIMTLSFVSLPVIPHLKLTTLGVVDVDAFRLADGNLE
jgi:adenine deaminase